MTNANHPLYTVLEIATGGDRSLDATDAVHVHPQLFTSLQMARAFVYGLAREHDDELTRATLRAAETSDTNGPHHQHEVDLSEEIGLVWRISLMHSVTV